LGVAQGGPIDNLDDTVGKRFPEALDRLAKAGARLSDEKLSLLDAMAEVNAKGGIPPAEALSIHRDRIARRGDAIDPNVRMRIERASKISAADFVDMSHRRAELVRAMDQRLVDLDVLVMPTTPIVAPRQDEVANAEEFARKNAQALRNTSIVNFFDLTAMSLPLPRNGALPTGLMLIARNGSDYRLLQIASAVEQLFTA